MKRISLLLTVVMFVIMAINAQAASFTVPDDGSIQDLIDNASGSLSITVRGGTYEGFTINRSATWGNPNLGTVEIIGKEGERVVIDGSSLAAITIDGGPDGVSVVLRNLEITGSSTYGIKARHCSSLTIEKCKIYGIAGEGMEIATASNLSIVDTEVYNIDRASGMDAVLYVNDCGNVAISNTKVHDNTNTLYPTKNFPGLRLTGALSVTIAESQFYRNHTTGVFLGGVSNTTTLTNVDLYENGSDVGGQGFSGSNLGVAVFTNVNSWSNREKGINIGDSDGLYGGNYTTLTYSGGQVYGNQDGGVRVSTRGDGVSISGLDIHDNTASSGAGGLYVACAGHPVRLGNLKVNNNTSTSSAGGISIANWSDVVLQEAEVVGNTSGGFGGGVYIIGGKEGGVLGISNTTIRNNTAKDRGGGIYLTVASHTMVGMNNIVFEGNKVIDASALLRNAEGGGGLYVAFQDPGSSYPRPPLGIANCRFIHNEGRYGAAAFFNDACYVSLVGGEVSGNRPGQQDDPSNSSALFFNIPGRLATSITGNTTQYDIYFNRSSSEENPNLDATSTWWGTTNEAQIDGRIYDHADNTSRGWVWTWPPLAAAPDPAHKVAFPYTDCQGTPLPEEREEGFGTIRGRVIDAWDADRTIGIPDAQVHLYLESGGKRRLVRETITDGAGYYAFYNLDVNSHISMMYPPPLDRIKTRARYTVSVTDASLSDKVLFNDDEREGRTYYKNQEKSDIGVAANDVVEVDFFMEEDYARAAKLWLVQYLSKESPNNYAPAESNIAAYVGSLEAGTMSPAQEEGIKRAAKAEMGGMIGYSYASDAADLFLESFGILVGNAFGEIWKARSKGDVAKARVEKAALSPQSKEVLKDSIDKVDATNSATVKVLSYVAELVFQGLENSLGGDVAPICESVMKDFLGKLASSGLRGQGTNVVQAAVSMLVKTFKPILMDGTAASYCKTTAPIITDTIEPQLLNWNSNDDEKLVQDLHKASQLIKDLSLMAGNSIESTVTLINATNLQKKMQENMEMLGAVFTASGIGAGYGQGLNKGAKVFQVTKYFTNAGAIAYPLTLMFHDIPAGVNNVARASFGLSTVPLGASAVAERLPLAHRAMLVDTTGWTEELDLAAVAVGSGCDSFLAALDQDKEAALGQLTNDAGTGLLDLFEALEQEEEELLAKAVVVRGVDATEKLMDYVEATSQLADEKARLVGTMVDLFLGIAEGRIANPMDPRHQAFMLSIKTIVNDIKTHLLTLKDRADALVAVLEGGESRPAVRVVTVGVAGTDGKGVIDTTPKDLKVVAVIKNFGSAGVQNLEARLDATDPDSFDSPAPAAIQTVGDNGTLGAGEETTVEWTVEYKGDLTEQMLWFGVRLLESGQEPQNFADLPAMGSISIESTLTDQDGDGMPGAYEVANGLDPATNDAAGDNDGDSLPNFEEWQLGTDPNKADTDADGLSDLAEISATKGFLTDPLNPDTDGDGTVDGQDRAPLDFLSTDPATPEPQSDLALSATQIVLSRSHNYQTITVSGTGGSELQWVALPSDPGLITLSPESGASGDQLTIGTPEGMSFSYYGSIRTSAYVFNITGGRKPPAIIEVTIQGDQGLAKGDADGSGQVELADAVFALQMAAGLVPEVPVYPDIRDGDVDGDRAIGLAEALYVLQEISGLRAIP